MRRGFTLIELSIVLVIVGLLIGGILVAQSMIITARLQNFIRQTQQFDVAVTNFQTKFASLPGDSIYFGGDGDGFIEDADGVADHFTGEIANFWVHLQQSGFTYQGKNFTATMPGNLFDLNSNTPNSPSLFVDKKTAVAVSHIRTVLVGLDNVTFDKNYFIFTNWNGLNLITGFFGSPGSNGRFVTGANAFAIDSKIDDGLPVSGKVFGYVKSTVTSMSGACATTLDFTSVYVTTFSTPICTMSIEMQSDNK